MSYWIKTKLPGTYLIRSANLIPALAGAAAAAAAATGVGDALAAAVDAATPEVLDGEAAVAVDAAVDAAAVGEAEVAGVTVGLFVAAAVVLRTVAEGDDAPDEAAAVHAWGTATDAAGVDSSTESGLLAMPAFSADKRAADSLGATWVERNRR